MRHEYSPAIERAFEAAQQWADKLSAILNPIHMLLALTDDEDSRVSVLLDQSGLRLEWLRTELQKLSLDFVSGTGETNLRAEELASRYGTDATITGDIYLVALLRSYPQFAKQLTHWGLDIPKLEYVILGEESPPIRLEENIRLNDPVEQIHAGRIIDVNANRVRESLRILDDYARFILNDSFLTQQIKTLRHDFSSLVDRIPDSLLIDSRETLRDVGTSITTHTEYHRESPSQVARINLKRLQEALRSLEEFGKLFGEAIASGFEEIRYRTYTLERSLVINAISQEKLADANLYVLLTGSHCESSLDWTIAEAVGGGADIFQLREKELSDKELIDRARRVRKWTRQFGVLFILNDRPDIARLVEADGVHLGQDDLSVSDARKILGADGLIGVSTHNVNQLRQAILDGANYVGVGPTFPSSTKKFEELAGLEFVRQAMQETSFPAFVIGGVNLDTIQQALDAGAKRIAVSAAICKAPEPRIAARTLKEALGMKTN
jgi:thiamine-phosphate pyrophosphorylase